MSKYITDFHATGNSTINVDAVCKDWNDRFVIYTSITDDEKTYNFVVYGKRKNTRLCKTQISQYQALAVVDRLKLIYVQNPVFRSVGAFHTESYIKAEVEQLAKIKKEKENELSIISKILYQYKKCL